MARTDKVLSECAEATRAVRVALEGVVSGVVFVRKVSCTSGCLPQLVGSLKDQCDAVKGLVDTLKDKLDELAD